MSARFEGHGHKLRPPGSDGSRPQGDVHDPSPRHVLPLDQRGPELSRKSGKVPENEPGGGCGTRSFSAVPHQLDGVGGVLSNEVCGCRPPSGRPLEGSFMSHRTRLITSLVLFVTAFAQAGELPTAEPEAVGLSPGKLDRLKPALQKLVDDGKIAGGVAVVARRGKVACAASFGSRNLETKEPMTEDTIFAIASMTKPITCVGVMRLVEQGKIGLDDPVSKYLPELKGLRVLGDPKDDTENEVATVPAERAIMVRDLLSNTSGFSYVRSLTNNDCLGKSYARAGVQGRRLKTIAEQVEHLGKAPLAHQPGEGWTYGLSHDVLGRLIEVVSGQSFDAYNFWIDPRDGKQEPIRTVPKTSVARFSTPEGWEDALLVLEAAGE